MPAERDRQHKDAIARRGLMLVLSSPSGAGKTTLSRKLLEADPGIELSVPVEAALLSGHDILFDIDWQGTQQLREKADHDLVSVFVLPPSMPDLERRLRRRAQDSDEVIRARMATAAEEMSHWAEYDYVVINTDIDRAFAEVQTILAAERLKRERQTGLSDFVRRLQAQL